MVVYFLCLTLIYLVGVRDLVASGLLPATVDVCKQGANSPCEYKTTYNVAYYGIRWVVREAAYFDGLLSALSGIAVALFTLTLWRSTENMWKSAENTALWQLRAYMRLELVKDSKAFLDERGVVQTQIMMANSGQTPAKDVIIMSNICVAEFPLVRPLPLLKDDNLEGSRADIYPGQIIPVSAICDTLITDDDILRIKNIDPKTEKSSARFYLYGVIYYRDVFGRSHETHFRCMTDGSPSDRSRFAWCRDGNEAT